MSAKKDITYMDSVHRDGKIWGIAICILLFSFPVAVSLIFGAVPEWSPLLKGLFATMPMYWAVGLVEIFTYVPMLGAGGTYLSFVTGNISNLKLPCAVDAMERANVKATSEEGEVISTIGAGDSLIAGFIHGDTQKYTIEDTLRLAVACGSSACLTEGTRPPEKEKIDEMFNKITVKKLA